LVAEVVAVAAKIVGAVEPRRSSLLAAQSGSKKGGRGDAVAAAVAVADAAALAIAAAAAAAVAAADAAVLARETRSFF
jgi:hypothetical protein